MSVAEPFCSIFTVPCSNIHHNNDTLTTISRHVITNWTQDLSNQGGDSSGDWTIHQQTNSWSVKSQTGQLAEMFYMKFGQNNRSNVIFGKLHLLYTAAFPFTMFKFVAGDLASQQIEWQSWIVGKLSSKLPESQVYQSHLCKILHKCLHFMLQLLADTACKLRHVHWANHKVFIVSTNNPKIRYSKSYR